MDVVVVGAGLAGLRCAGVLTRAGYDVTVLEAASTVGGRVATDRVDGFLVDRGFQVLNPAYPAVRRWVDVDALHLRKYDAGVLVRTDTGLRTLADPLRAPAGATGTLRSGLLGPRDLVGLARWLSPALALPQRSLRGPDRSLFEALDRVGATGDLRRRVLERFLAGVLADSHGETSSRFVRLLVRSFVLGRPGVPQEGMQAFPAQLAAGLTELRLGRAARSLTAGDRSTGPSVETDDGALTARAVVVAADPRTAHRLLGRPEPEMHGLVTWWYAADTPPTTSRMLALDGRGATRPQGPVWNTGVASNAAPSYAPAGRHLVHATTLLDRPDGDAPDADVRRHLAEIYGCDAARWEVVAHHRIPHALPVTPPGHPVRQPVDLGGGVFVCGDHRDTASIQGALVSGNRAAAAVRRALGRPGA